MLPWLTVELPQLKCLGKIASAEILPQLKCLGKIRTGRKPVGSSVGALGAHSVYRILHENVPTVEGYKSHSGSAETGRFISWWTWCTLGLPNFA